MTPSRRAGFRQTSHALMTLLVAGTLAGVCVTYAQAAWAQPVVIETVPVGNPGNAADVQSNGTYGAVDFEFFIGKAAEVPALSHRGLLAMLLGISLASAIALRSPGEDPSAATPC